MIKYIIIILVFLTSCSSISEIKRVDNIMLEDKAYTEVTLVDLSSTDLMIVQHAKNRYMSLREKWQDRIIEAGFDDLITTSAELMEDYNLLVNQYESVMNVVRKNSAKYSKEQLEYFSKINGEFYKLYDSVEDMRETEKVTRNLFRLISIVGHMLLK